MCRITRPWSSCRPYLMASVRSRASPTISSQSTSSFPPKTAGKFLSLHLTWIKNNNKLESLNRWQHNFAPKWVWMMKYQTNFWNSSICSILRAYNHMQLISIIRKKKKTSNFQYKNFWLTYIYWCKLHLSNNTFYPGQCLWCTCPCGMLWTVRMSAWLRNRGHSMLEVWLLLPHDTCVATWNKGIGKLLVERRSRKIHR